MSSWSTNVVAARGPDHGRCSVNMHRTNVIKGRPSRFQLQSLIIVWSTMTGIPKEANSQALRRNTHPRRTPVSLATVG